MLRVVEIIGLLAPIGGAVLLFLYRKRSRIAYAWGIIACLLGVAASGIGLFGLRLSILGAIETDAGVTGVVQRMDSWTLLRFALLVLATGLLVIAASVDRHKTRPVRWMLSGIALTILGVGVQFVVVDLGSQHQRLTAIVGVALEIAQAALLGLGFLVLCIAAVAYREGRDGRQEPTRLAARIGSTMWRLYTDSRRRTGR